MERSIVKETEKRPSTSRADLNPFLMVALGGMLWYATYQLIQPLANWLAYDLLGLPQGSHLGEALAFFIYDVPKILLLLGGMVFLITVLRSFFSPEQTRAWLGGKREGVGNLLAAALGVVTPFCSCSAVPLFIGFVEFGHPPGGHLFIPDRHSSSQ